MEIRFNICGLLLIFILILNLNQIQKIESKRILEFRDVQFSPSDQPDVTYVSSTSYVARGMYPFYKLTNQILDIYIGEDAIPDGYLIPRDRGFDLGPKVENGEWNDLLKHYWGILLVLCISALIIVLMPIIGFCFCCCRCAGACGGRSQPFDKKHDTCRRIMLGIFLILTGTGIIFGVVIAFVTNSYLQAGIVNATTTARESVDDTQKFLKSTSQQANHILVKNYDELSTHLDYMLSETADIVILKFENESKAISLTQLTKFAETLPQIKINLERMRIITKDLRINASQLNDALRGVKRILLTTLNDCTATQCRDVLTEYEIGNLDVNGIDYNKLPDMTTTIESISALLTNNVVENIKTANNQFTNIKDTLTRKIQDNVPKITQAIQDAGFGIRTVSENITITLERISNIAGNSTYKYFDDADYYIKEYSNYSYYAGITVSSILLFVLVCIIFGLLCGICGKRPDGYGDDCCNKGAGSRFLIIGVAVIFLTISLLTAYALAYFLVGLALHRGICVPLNNPATDEVFNYVDQLLDLNTVIYPNTVARQRRLKNVEPFRVSDVIVSCHDNDTIYTVLRLENYFNITDILDYPQKYGIVDQFNELLKSVTVDEVNILPEETETAIANLRDSKLQSFESYKFVDNLNATITRHNLSTIANKLRETAAHADTNPELYSIRTVLLKEANNLDDYQRSLVTPMTMDTTELLALAVGLENDLKFDKHNFTEAIDDFLREIRVANAFIQNEGTPFVQAVAAELTESLQHEIVSYLKLVVDTTKNDLGKCGPLSIVYKSLYVAGCNRIVDPFNTFWAGVSWCVFLFLPTIIICVKLSTLYQKSDPYPGPLVESEYLYDAYSERDNIPVLVQPSKKQKRRKDKNRRHNSRDRRADYYEETGSPHGPPNGPRDARYNDMAPNIF